MLVPAIAFSSWLVAIPLKPHRRAQVRRPTVSLVAAQQPMTDMVVEPASETIADRATPDEPSAPEDDATASEATETTGERAVYRGIITPEIARVARTFLDLPMGAVRAAEVEGHRFVFVLERHFHPQGFVGAPNGWHKGVTVYELR
jgi:hypothetical protein